MAFFTIESLDVQFYQNAKEVSPLGFSELVISSSENLVMFELADLDRARGAAKRRSLSLKSFDLSWLWEDSEVSRDNKSFNRHLKGLELGKYFYSNSQMHHYFQCSEFPIETIEILGVYYSNCVLYEFKLVLGDGRCHESGETVRSPGDWRLGAVEASCRFRLGVEQIEILLSQKFNDSRQEHLRSFSIFKEYLSSLESPLNQSSNPDSEVAGS